MKHLAILLTVFNRKEKTLECLKNIYSQNNLQDISIDIFITDDGCTDGTSTAIKSLYPAVHIIKGNGNLFWNRGMWTAWNTASQHRKYDFYLWLNDDTILFNHAIKDLLWTSEEKNNKSIIVGATCASDKKTITYGGRYDGYHLKEPNGKLTKVKTFNGNIVLIPKSVFEVLGNLDYRFRHSKGDTDYGFRAIEAGISIFQSKDFLGICDRHKQHAKWCNPNYPLKERWKALFSPTGYNPNEQFYYEKRHFGLFKALFHNLTIYLRCLFPKFWIKIGHAKI